ncbi:MAG: hypothetical protein IIB43_08460, partial [Candidatus Marinimicrobia bacterium]|nr:hypothetical protein [Candidatus Neomarinimicrobiota bacterium]
MGRIAPLPKALLIEGATIYDPATGKTRRGDLAVKNGRLIEPEKLGAAKVERLDARGALVTH